MATIYVAASKANQEWASDVGLGKNVFKLGVVEDGPPEEALAGFAGQDDWKVLAAEDAGELTEAEALDKLGRKHKPVDPTYYPKLRGATGLFRINVAAVENAMLVAIALENREPPKNFKVKPADIAKNMITNAR
jgi:hypothetical protein